MKNKIFFSLIFFMTLFLTISAISASEDINDGSLAVLDDNSPSLVNEVDVDDISSSVVNQDGMDDNSQSVLSQEDVDSSLETTVSQGDVDGSSETVVTQSDEDTNELEKDKSEAEISAKDVVAYNNYKGKFTVTLKSDDTPLANKNILIVLNDVKYNKVTDAKGQATIEFKLKTGNYTVKYYFDGDEDYNGVDGDAKITVKSTIPTTLKFIDKKITYHVGSVREIFRLRLVDVANNPVSGKKVRLKICGKKYVAKTNANGYVTFYISNLKKGTRIAKFSFSKSGKYLSSSGSTKIKVKAKLTKDNGYWVDQYDMFKVNFKKLSKKGTKHIFLLASAFRKHGAKKVLKWIRKAHNYDIKVHIWVCVFSTDGHFMPPAYKNGVYNRKRMNYVLKRVKYYLKFKEIDGIHFDYLRYPGTAYKHKNGVKAVNYFVKKAVKTIRKKSQRIIISSAVMSEPNGMKRYYAQDIPTLSKHLDVIIPMVYKGNYHASSKWIKRTTKWFVKKSKGAQIWSGLQTYKSDRNLRKLSYKSLRKDARNAKKGGASGVILFKFGLSQNLNFNKL